MKLQSLHPQVLSTGGTGMKVLPGAPLHIWCRMPLSVATMNVSAGLSRGVFKEHGGGAYLVGHEHHGTAALGVDEHGCAGVFVF